MMARVRSDFGGGIGHIDVEGVFCRIDKHWRSARSRNAAGCGKECE